MVRRIVGPRKDQRQVLLQGRARVGDERFSCEVYSTFDISFLKTWFLVSQLYDSRLVMAVIVIQLELQYELSYCTL